MTRPDRYCIGQVYEGSEALRGRRHPAAWPLTWGVLMQFFPLSLPFILYWADGIRPNLIYRHRFERLVRPKEALPDVL